MEQDTAQIIDNLVDKDFVVFAGTGCVQGTGIPTWRSLLEALQSKVTDTELGLVNIEKLAESSYPGFAQRVFDYLSGSNRQKEYFAVLRGQITVTDAEFSPHQIDIIKATKKIVTTNYDNTFEKAFERLDERGVITRPLPEIQYDDLTQNKCIVYLHGRIDENAVVLKQDDYDKFYPSVSSSTNNPRIYVLEDFLKQVWLRKTILFIGFSFSDRHLLKLFQFFHDQTVEQDKYIQEWKSESPSRVDTIQHYALMPDKKILFKDRGGDKLKSGTKECEELQRDCEKRVEELKKELPKARIDYWEYEEGHATYQRWLKEIYDRREAKTSAFHPRAEL